MHRALARLARLALVLAGCASALASAAPPPAEAFFRPADFQEVALSPSGRYLALTSAKGLKNLGLVVLDLAPGGKVQRAAQFSDGDVRQVRWVNDTRLVFSVMDPPGSGAPQTLPGLYAVKSDGSELRQLVRRRWLGPIRSGDEDTRVLNWNHFLLAVPARAAGDDNEEVLIHEVSEDEQRLSRPLWLNTRSGRTRRVDVAIPDDTVGWLADARGELRVALTRKDKTAGALWRGPGQTAWTPLYSAPLLHPPFGPHSVDVDGRLYVLRATNGTGNRVLKQFDFDKNEPMAQPLVQVPDFDFNGGLLHDPETGRLLGVRVLADGLVTVWLDEAMKRFQAEVDRQLPGKINIVQCRRCGQPDMVALVHAYSDHDPGQLWFHTAQPEPGQRKWRPVFKALDGIAPQQMASLDLHRIKARDGQTLPVWVTRPDDAQGPLPAVVLVHGGPYVRGTSWRWAALPQFLASRGYLVIEPEFRGSTGYGEQHYRSGWKQWGQAMQDDVADALRWAQAQGLASDRACIAGASYGGYSTLMGLAKDPDLYRCGIAWVAVADLELLVKGSWWVQDDIGLARQLTVPEMIGDPVKDAAMLAAHSPVKLAHRIKSPLLLAYGEEDLRVPLEHGKRMRDALIAAGQKPVWVTYPGEGHGFAKPENAYDFARRAEAFLAEHLGVP